MREEAILQTVTPRHREPPRTIPRSMIAAANATGVNMDDVADEGSTS